MLKKAELAQFRQLLLGIKARIQGDVEDLTDAALERTHRSGDSKSPTHIAELGSQAYEQEFSLRVVERDQEVLEEIHAALKRIENGTYGLCAGCVEDGRSTAKASIAKARLKVIPYARNCAECERKREELAL